MLLFVLFLLPSVQPMPQQAAEVKVKATEFEYSTIKTLLNLLQVMLGSACVLEAVGSDGTLDERMLERWESFILMCACDARTDSLRKRYR